MEETKFVHQELELFSNPPECIEIDDTDEKMAFANNSEYDSNEDFILGNSGFDNLPSESYFDDNNGFFKKVMGSNRVFKRLFNSGLNEISDTNSHQKDFNKGDVDEFFGKSSPKEADSSNRSEKTHIQGSSHRICQNGAYLIEPDVGVISREEIVQEKKEKISKIVNKARGKKRDQKRKRRNKEATDSEKFSFKGSSSTVSEENRFDKITPQKRKGTIWKILFPNKNFDDENCELERLVCSQVENQIAKNPKVIECYKQLKAFEQSEEAKNMTKGDFTKKKNRISAQLSRERREAIMHSLINVCINNIKSKKELDADIEEVKLVLNKSL